LIGFTRQPGTVGSRLENPIGRMISFKKRLTKAGGRRKLSIVDSLPEPYRNPLPLPPSSTSRQKEAAMTASRHPIDHLARRRLLQVGSLGMLGLNLPEFLWARSPYGPASATGGKEKSCIMIVMGGGPSQLDLWDMKPNAPDGIRGPYKPVSTTVPGMQ